MASNKEQEKKGKKPVHYLWVKIKRRKNTLFCAQDLTWSRKSEEEADEGVSELPSEPSKGRVIKVDFDFKKPVCQGAGKASDQTVSVEHTLVASGRWEFGYGKTESVRFLQCISCQKAIDWKPKGEK